MAVPEDDMSVMSVNSTMNIKALLSIVSNVSVSSSIESKSLVNFISILSNNGSNSNSESVSLLVGNNPVSVGEWSDSSSSSIKDEPLLVVLWCIVSNSKSVLLSTNVLVPEESSEVSHSRFNLESNSIGEWLSWVSESSLVNDPSLIESVMAVPVDNMSVVNVSSSMYIKAHLSVESNVLQVLVQPLDSLGNLSSVWSNDYHDSSSQTVSGSSRESVVSSSPGSDSLSSRVEGPPLSLVFWVVVLDVSSEIVMTNMVSPVESSVSSHS